MAAPTKTVIGWKNLCLEDGVTFTPSSEHASHDADNIGKPNPESFWRATTLAGAQVVVDFSALGAGFSRAEMAVAALLYTNATPHRNAIANANYFTSATWITYEVINVLREHAVTPPAEVAGLTPWSIRASSNNDMHYKYNTFVKPVAAEQDEWVTECWVKQHTAHMEVRVAGATPATDYAWAKVTTTSGAQAIESSGDAGAFTLGAASIVKTSNDGWALVRMTFTPDTSANIETRLMVLDAAYGETFAGAGERFYVCGPQLYRGAVAPEPTTASDDIEGDYAPFWRVQGNYTDSWGSPQYDSGSLYIPVAGNLRTWKKITGFVHSFHVPAPAQHPRYVRISLYDEGNQDSQLDTGVAHIGPSWSVTNSSQWKTKRTVDKFGRRVWDSRFSMVPKAEIEAEALPMVQTCGVGETDQTAAGGQDFAENRRPILVIEDPANPSQSEILYGWIISFDYELVQAEKDSDGNYSGGRYNISMRVREVLP